MKPTYMTSYIRWCIITFFQRTS